MQIKTNVKAGAEPPTPDKARTGTHINHNETLSGLRVKTAVRAGHKPY